MRLKKSSNRRFDSIHIIIFLTMRKSYFDAFIDLATIHIWIQRILLVG